MKGDIMWNKHISIDFTLPLAVTLVFFVLKIVGYINWSWWLIFTPIYVGVIISIIMVIWVFKE